MNTSSAGKNNQSTHSEDKFGGARPAPAFLNETHRDMVTQAQKATNDFSLPQSSTLIQDDEMDPTVNEVANAYRSSQERNNNTSNAADKFVNNDSQNGLSSEERQQQLHLARLQHLAADDKRRPLSSHSPGGKFQQRRHHGSGGRTRPANNAGRYPGDLHRPNPPPPSRMGILLDNMWLTILVMFLYVLVCFVPIEAFLQNHVQVIANIGYAPLLSKSLFFGVLVFGVKTLLDVTLGFHDKGGGGAGGRRRSEESEMIGDNEYNYGYENEEDEEYEEDEEEERQHNSPHEEYYEEAEY